MTTTMTTTADNRTLAARHADSVVESIRTRVEAGAPFGYVDDGGEWHDVDECQDDCERTEAGAYDYLDSVLDIHYIVNADRTYRSARILIGFGGPNVWIDTRTLELEVHWDRSEYRSLPASYCHALDDAIAELWEMAA